MKVKLPVKIHNRFDIEVKDVTTGEIIQRGQAENIVLSHTFTHSDFCGTIPHFGRSIHYGRGTGTLDPSRTTLFDRISGKESTLYEYVGNQAPLTSYATRKMVIMSTEHVGETITEVGIGGSATNTTIFTHALIKDSEGNPLSLGPKTGLQEITIYATVYFQPNFEDGITLNGNLALPERGGNGLLVGALGVEKSGLKGAWNSPDYRNRLYVNNEMQGIMVFNNSFVTPKIRVETTQGNSKIKTVSIRQYTTNEGAVGNVFSCDILTLAQNNSTIWSGWAFDHTPIGIGDGSETTFSLTWDEVWLDKPKKVYVDGVEKTTGVTWSEDSIIFDTAPEDSAVITADYWVKYIPKDSDHVLDVQFSILFGEGEPV